MKVRQLIVGGAVLISALLGITTAVYAVDPNVYKVAYIYPEVLIVRAAPNTDAREIDRVYQGQEVEVVEECGDWAKVCIALDSYGYINAYHFAYKTYYADGTMTSTEQVADEEPAYAADYEDTYYYSTYAADEPYYSAYAADEPSYNDYSVNAATYETPVTTTEDTTTYEYTETVNTSPTTAPVETNSNSTGQQISDSAKQYVGNPYVYGGESLETGADCSGFTKAVLESNGYSVNGRTAADQAAGGTQIGLNEAQAGDLIYYDNGNGVYHIAIYNGDGTVTHSSNSNTGVTVSDMNYSGNAAGAVRYWS